MNKSDKSPNNKDKTYINGPINYIKLVNKKTKQEVWLLLDFHVSIDLQKECEEFDSKDINKFLYKELIEAKEPIDFFLEINPTQLNQGLEKDSGQEYYKYKDKYIAETVKIFKKIFNNNPKKINSNIRLHYIDIRDYTLLYDILSNIEQIKSMLYGDNLSKSEAFIKCLENIKQNVIFVLELIKSIKNGNSNLHLDKNIKIDYIKQNIVKKNIPISETSENITENKNITESNNNSTIKIYSHEQIVKLGFILLLEKILKEYKNHTLKKLINEYMEDFFVIKSKKVIQELDSLIKEITIHGKVVKQNNMNQKLLLKKHFLNKKNNLFTINMTYDNNFDDLNEINNYFLKKINLLSSVVIDMWSVFMDTYFLRRLLEKEYIKKSIVYTGCYHSTVYLWFLVKYFDYSIEKYHYIDTKKLKKNPVENLEKIIKRTHNPEELFNYVFPDKFSQCIVIENL